ncbi:type II secretion system minor pseudopilin [Candidatus Magnetomonas plexicatena]|uniref:general secretion pathway protein GspK n=1 Tax=Candidatus Magnetomonas plexicatena TaxID=2552947 RepID=UPI001C78EC5B|nr:general secretion pathway protein GspK [Nitrospirales bacterium LBB_01]
MLRNESGSAVLLTIMIASIIITVGVGFNWIVKEHIATAGALKDKSEAMILAESSFDTAMFAVLTGKLTQDGVAFADNSLLGASQIIANGSPLWVNENIILRLQDTNGMVSLAANGSTLTENSASDLRKLINTVAPGKDADSIIDCINDWTDPDDLVRTNGAESDYYRKIGAGYEPRNFHLQYLEEIILVKGVDIQLFKKLKPFITMLRNEGFNVNTAKPELIVAHYGLSADVIEPLRQQMKTNTTGAVDSLNQIGVDTLSFSGASARPTEFFEITLAVRSGESLYHIKSGISIRDTTGFSPHSVYYWKEG